MTNHDETYQQLCDYARETAILGAIEGLLGWDERTKMPPQAGPYRAEQMAYISGLIHQRQTDPRVGDWLAELVDSPLAADRHSDTGTNIRELRREYDKKTKLPQSLVEELTRTSVLGQQTWIEARKNDDFKQFQPILKKTFDLKRQQAAAIGYDERPYDALLDDYEPHESAANVATVLERLRVELVELIDAIAGSSREPDVSILKRNYPADVQERFGTSAAAAIGFDFQRGRLDVTHHPFCSGMGPHDTRITTRYDERFFSSAFFGILHEAGHGIYDQGLVPEQHGLPLGACISLGIHESQSRMWENLVGRSRGFWENGYGGLKAAFVEALTNVSLDDFFFAINDVRPSLIRVEADEATYNLHILIRSELEQAMLNDDLPVADLPAAWNQRYRDYLGIDPPSDADGCLQDVHWSAGYVGYFPTYSLGNLYASQFFEKADDDLGGLESMFREGDFQPLGDWLRANIHQHGRRYTAAELVERVTGQPLTHAPLMRHLRGKFGPLYGVA